MIGIGQTAMAQGDINEMVKKAGMMMMTVKFLEESGMIGYERDLVKSNSNNLTFKCCKGRQMSVLDVPGRDV